MDISKLTIKQKVKLLKKLVNSLDVVATGQYGRAEPICGDDIFIINYDDSFHNYKNGETVVIATNICTG